MNLTSLVGSVAALVAVLSAVAGTAWKAARALERALYDIHELLTLLSDVALDHERRLSDVEGEPTNVARIQTQHRPR